MSQHASRQKRESALRFVPEMLVDYLSRSSHQGNTSIQPSSFFMHGVCLLVDISGFTKLSGDFCSKGKGGIDELQLATNGFMEKLVEIIYSFGGDIIKFAGDAIICVFSADFVTNMSSKDLRRSMCGFESPEIDFSRISSVSADYTRVPGIAINTPSSISVDVVLRVMHCAHVLRAVQTDSLSVHVAMSCGEMCFGILGGVENRWECLISGPCIHELSDCLDDAPSKEAVVSHDCAMKLFETVSERSEPYSDIGSCNECASTIATSSGAYDFKIDKLPSGNYRIIDVTCCAHREIAVFPIGRSVSDLKDHRLQWMNKVDLFVPLPVADELGSCDELHSLAEIREVTTMFMKWDSYDADGKHRDLLQLQPCFYQAQRILHNTGAYLRQFLVDDKGCVLIGCWGMPYLSYLDNAHRALSAAAQIKYELNKLDMFCSFGITTGDVYCGTVGSALRMEYAAIGSVVNMSARLMCKANGGILLDDATHSRLPHTATKQLKSLSPIKVKGREEPLQVYEYAPSVDAGAAPIKQKVVEDHEISQACRTTLSAVLRRIATPADHTPPVVRAKPDPQMRTNFFTAWLTGGTKSVDSTPGGMPVVLVQGKEGSGRTTVLTWLHEQAISAALPVCYVKLSRKTSHVEFGMWRKIFQQLMPRDFYENVAQQRNHALLLLNRVFPGASKQVRTVGLQVMQAVLGLNCGVPVDSPVRKTSVSFFAPVRAGSRLGPDVSAPRLASMKLKATSVRIAQVLPVEETLLKIFAHLLKETATLVIIGSLSKADEGSLQLLRQLVLMPCRSAIVCSVLLDAQTAPNHTKRDYPFARKASVSYFEHTSTWEKHKATLQTLPATTTLTLVNSTPEEIDQMLKATLKIHSVPPEISQLVQDFSGGSYFWVREILQFIKEYGAEQFLAAVGESKAEESRPQRELSTARLRSTFSKSNINGPPTLLGRSVSRPKSMLRQPSMRQPSMRQLPVTTNQVHLDKLVLCRFENLTPEMQRILRTASIIGVSFDTAMLAAILPSHLAQQLADSLVTFLNQRWLYQDTDNESLYAFAHPHQIIYELTPSSERAHQHQLVADYILRAHGNDETQYAALCYHYQHCDIDNALQYCAKATSVLLDTEVIFDFGDCLELLQSMEPHCRTTKEIALLRELAQRLRDGIEDCELMDDTYTTSLPIIGAVLTIIKKALFGPKHSATAPLGVDLDGSTPSTHTSPSTTEICTARMDGAASTASDDPCTPLGSTFALKESTQSESTEQRAQRQLLAKTNDLLSLLNDKCAYQRGMNLAEERQLKQATD